MKLTIIPSDGAVYKDNFSFSNLVLSGIPEDVHALQWNGTKGWIEFKEDENFHKPANEIIDALPDWAVAAVSKWDEAQAVLQAQPISEGAQDL